MAELELALELDQQQDRIYRLERTVDALDQTIKVLVEKNSELWERIHEFEFLLGIGEESLASWRKKLVEELQNGTRGSDGPPGKDADLTTLEAKKQILYVVANALRGGYTNTPIFAYCKHKDPSSSEACEWCRLAKRIEDGQYL